MGLSGAMSSVCLPCLLAALLVARARSSCWASMLVLYKQMPPRSSADFARLGTDKACLGVGRKVLLAWAAATAVCLLLVLASLDWLGLGLGLVVLLLHPLLLVLLEEAEVALLGEELGGVALAGDSAACLVFVCEDGGEELEGELLDELS